MGRALSSSWQGKFAVFVQPNCLRQIVMSPPIQRLCEGCVNSFSFGFARLAAVRQKRRGAAGEGVSLALGRRQIFPQVWRKRAVRMGSRDEAFQNLAVHGIMWFCKPQSHIFLNIIFGS